MITNGFLKLSHTYLMEVEQEVDSVNETETLDLVY